MSLWAIFALIGGVGSAQASGGGNEKDLGSFVLHHISNSHEWKVTPFGPTLHLPQGWNLGGVDFSISLHVFFILVGSALLILLLGVGSKRKGLMHGSLFAHLIEVLVVFIRDEVVKPNVGEEDAPRWTPFFLTLFFFILILNLLSLIPGMPAATSNINFTAAMAVLIFLVYNISGIAQNGVGHYFANLVPKGLPIAILPLIAVLEFLGLFTKGFALAIRLFANITAGHVLILSLLSIIIVFKSYLAAIPFVPFTLFIYLIEVLVAFLQAYVFTLLASLFVGQALHQEH